MHVDSMVYKSSCHRDSLDCWHEEKSWWRIDWRCLPLFFRLTAFSMTLMIVKIREAILWADQKQSTSQTLLGLYESLSISISSLTCLVCNVRVHVVRGYFLSFFFCKQLSWLWDQRSSGSIVHHWQYFFNFADWISWICRGLHLDMHLRYFHLLSPTSRLRSINHKQARHLWR